MGAGTFTSTPDTEKHTNTGQGPKISYVASHMCGWRRFMEDAHLTVSSLSDDKLSLFAVFDGHGGAEVAIFAKRHFVQQLELNPNFRDQNYEQALKETFLNMDQLMKNQNGKAQIKQIQKELYQDGNSIFPTQSQAGCTANVWLITPQFIYVANAGDSRGVICINGKHHQMSKDHKPDDKLELQRITKAGGQVIMGRVNGSLNLSRALGDFEFKSNANLSAEEQMITANPDISKIKNENIQFVILGCDGIWEEKSSEQMIGWVKQRINRRKQNFEGILQELFDELIAEKITPNGTGTDNMSAILINFNIHHLKKPRDQIDVLLKNNYFKISARKMQERQQYTIKVGVNDEISKLLRQKYIM